MIQTTPNVTPTARYELREVAAILAVNKATVLRWTAQGKLIAVKRKLNNRRVWTGTEIMRFWRINA